MSTESTPTRFGAASSDWPSLDELLAQEGAKCTAWDDVAATGAPNPNGMAYRPVSTEQLSDLRDVVREADLALFEVLEALAVLIGPEVLTRVRTHVDTLLGAANDLGELVAQALQEITSHHDRSAAAGRRAMSTHVERDNARRLVVLLEGQLASARDLVEASYGPDAAASAFDAVPDYGTTDQVTTVDLTTPETTPTTSPTTED